MPTAFKEDGTIINTTEMLALNIYKTFYTGANTRGVAQAKAVMFFILVAVLALAQLRATRDKEVQQ
jgi:raffinose/stachyose/melibiose transport system permease protein